MPEVQMTWKETRDVLLGLGVPEDCLPLEWEPRIDLRGFDFRGASLRGAYLREVMLVATDLSGADLSYADLTGADFRTLWDIDGGFDEEAVEEAVETVKPRWFYKLICKLSFGTIHLRCSWEDDGIHCIDCGYFKSKEQHLADLHSGGGW